MASSGLDVEFTQDGFALIRMKRGQNRINPEFLNLFSAALDDIEKNPSSRAVILTGEGRFFSNGLDLDYLSTLGSDGGQQFLETVNKFLDRILTFPMPTVAVINGHAFAGGGLIALACDFRVMRTGQGWISWNEIFLNIRLSAYFLELLRTKIPPGSAQLQAIVYGKRFTAEEALKSGIVDVITPPETLFQEATSLLKKTFGRQPYDRDMFRLFKQDLYQSLHQLAYKPIVRSSL